MTTIEQPSMKVSENKNKSSVKEELKNEVVKMQQNKAQQNKAEVNQKTLGIYHQVLLTRRINLSIAALGGNVRQLLEQYINLNISGLCGPEGYIAPNSAKVMNYSAPVLKAEMVMFQVTFECLVCNPVEGMIVNAYAKNITKAGIRAEVGDNSDEMSTTPMVIFVSRDHHAQNKSFNDVNVNDEIQVKIIGVRFKLNDKYISAIAQLVDKPTIVKTIKKKPKLVIVN